MSLSDSLAILLGGGLTIIAGWSLIRAVCALVVPHLFEMMRLILRWSDPDISDSDLTMSLWIIVVLGCVFTVLGVWIFSWGLS